MKDVSLAMATIGILCVSTLVSACNSAQADWTKASGDNTILAYQNFLAAHPENSHASEARAMILHLEDDTGWQDAQHAATASSYQTYLQQFPRGTHALAAKEEVTTIERAAAWKDAEDTGTAAAFQAFLRTYSTGPEVARARAKLRGLTSYRVHLATESTFERARQKKDQVKSPLNDSTVQFAIIPDAGENSFSVDAINMTEQGAKNACEAFKQEREACRVIKD